MRKLMMILLLALVPFNFNNGQWSDVRVYCFRKYYLFRGMLVGRLPGWVIYVKCAHNARPRLPGNCSRARQVTSCDYSRVSHVATCKAPTIVIKARADD